MLQKMIKITWITYFYLPFLGLLNSALMAQAPSFPIPFEEDQNTSATYQQTIAYYEALAVAYPSKVQLTAHGTTDSGHPLHQLIVSLDGDFSPESLRKKGRKVLFINNAIHPGEPCGVDASMLLTRDYLQDEKLQQNLSDVVLVIIPFYNIGGGLNRGSYSRANQNGPVAHGFRGNAKNLDLNRDFIKCDSRNARTFNQLYARWSPDVFIDNHTSNGADYQYTMTLIPTQHNKLEPTLASFLNDSLLPELYADMAKSGWEMTPYVYARNTPDDGIASFLDLPRYSSGYAALHHAFSFMPETHMLKPFKDRVRSTYAFMDAMIRYLSEDGDQLLAAREKAIQNTIKQQHFPLNWQLDRDRSDTITFKGYTAKYKTSAISGLDRLYYDRNEPYEKPIPFYNDYKTTLEVEKPLAYIIPQGYREVIERLEWNGVAMERLNEDVELEVELYSIKDFETSNSPYEGHYLHSKVEVEKSVKKWGYHKGDYVIFTNQPVNRYIVETLEPQAPDSYFAWNFFDGILMQKEYFSAYVFEDLAAAFLEDHPEVRDALEKKKAEDEEFAKSARAQLNFVYEHSPYYEKTHRVYPVGRLVKKTALPLGD